MKKNKIIKVSLFVVISCFFSSYVHATNCDEGEVGFWPVAIGNPPYPEYSTPEAMCENWPDEHIESLHGPDWDYHSTNTNSLRTHANCLYTRDGGPPQELMAGGTLTCDFPTPPEDDYQNEDVGCSVNNTPRPCNVATGNKFRAEVDFNHPTLSFVRYYNSQVPGSPRSIMGQGWNHPYQVRVLRSRSSRATVVNRRGDTETFRYNPFITRFENDINLDNDLRLELSDDNELYYKVIYPSGAQDQFHIDGRILYSEDTNGKRTTYHYETLGLTRLIYLVKVTDHYGNSIKFDYELIPSPEESNESGQSVVNDSGTNLGSRGFLIFEYRRVNKVTDPFGAEYLYRYDDNYNLTQVIYPDTTSDDSDNPRKTYHYENENFPNHLTGITDENDERYATFAYDEDGRAVVSELGVTTNQVGQEKIELDYQDVN